VKIHAEVECTPEEARTLLGLPDVAPMQKAVLERVEKQMLDAAGSLSAEGILKMWFSTIPAASEQYLRTFGGLLRSAARRTTEEPE